MELDYYGILGVRPDASTDDIKAAYRRLVRRFHPDSNPRNPGATIQFHAISEAHETLIDPGRRRIYDESLMRRRSRRSAFFTLRSTPSKQSAASLPDPQVVYILAEIVPDASTSSGGQRRETNLNIALVLDQSNSMNGSRLDRVKVAAHQIVDTLSPNDIISLITFNDRSEVIIPATPVNDKAALKARINMISASGGTEMYQGLSAGMDQVRRYLNPKLVNHIVLITDGHTFGDQEQCLALARTARGEGVSISAMGLGHDWNDDFLDKIASSTGGSSAYIDSAGSVVRFLNDHVRALANAFAERMNISIAPDPDLQLEMAFKLTPAPQPLGIEDGLIPLGNLQHNRPISILLQLQLPANAPEGFRPIARILVKGDILENDPQDFQTLSDISIEISNNAGQDAPPPAIMEALSKLTLYRMQERAKEALDRGDIGEATRRLENLATRLLDMGEEELAGQALAEARRVAHTNMLSDRGKKTLKFHTRLLLAGSASEDGN